MIQNGVIKVRNIFGVPFKTDLISVANSTSRPQYPMSASSITVHNTGNSNKGANAEMHTEYVDNTTLYVSWHFTVDDKQIIQELPVNESAWHVGDGANGAGNRTSIGIEICEQQGIDWQKARSNAIKLIVWLMTEDNNIKKVYPHQKWTGKYCPHKILDEGWDKFLNDTIKLVEEVEQNMGWEQDLGVEAIKELGKKGLIADVASWCEKDLIEPTPLWLFFEMINRMDYKNEKDIEYLSKV